MRITAMLSPVLKGAIALIMVVAILYLSVPILYTFVITFDPRTYLGKLPPPGFTLKWFKKFFTNGRFISSIRVSLILAAVTMAVSTTIGLLAALAIKKGRWRGSEAMANFLLSPLIVPGVVKGFGLLIFLTTIGIKVTLLQLLLGHIIITLPYTSRSILAMLDKSTENMEFAAANLGANKWNTFWHVLLPLIRPGVAAGGIFAFAMSLDNVALTIFLVSPTTRTLPVVLMSTLKSRVTPIIAAGATILVIFSAVMVLLIEWAIGIEEFTGMGISNY